jgi:hypothetical protein
MENCAVYRSWFTIATVDVGNPAPPKGWRMVETL